MTDDLQVLEFFFFCMYGEVNAVAGRTISTAVFFFFFGADVAQGPQTVCLCKL